MSADHGSAASPQIDTAGTDRTDMALLEVQDLSLDFASPGGAVQAVNGISYNVEPGEIVAIVGESGSGKTAAALAVLGLIPQPPGRIVSGRIFFGGQNLLDLSEEELRRIRGPGISMVFQEPMTSLNPLLTIGRQLTEAMRLHLGYSKAAAIERAVELMTLVGISDPQGRLAQYPHQFSGGMRQRVMIAIALACKPRLIIADEPTTALDVTIQAQILSLLKNLTEQLGVALVIITHNLGIVARYAARVNVMYAGRIVEYGLVGDVFRKPSHPYTIGLLNSVPRLDRPRGALLDPIPGSPPDLTMLGAGCAFEPRCSFVVDRCRAVRPDLNNLGEARAAACWETEAAMAMATP
jgi:oligopeptide/dipeptide ABC transporter ATP-binding protein